MSKQFVISVMAADRVGIVADVTNALQTLSGNLEDMSQTVLRGFFTMILLGDFPDDVTAEQVKETLTAIDPAHTLDVMVTEGMAEKYVAPVVDDNFRYILTATGPDRIGLVATVTDYLRSQNINIVDLSTCVSDSNYVMMFEIILPASFDLVEIRKKLYDDMGEQGLQVVLQHQRIYRKTNEI